MQPASKRLVTEAAVPAHIENEVTTPGTPTATALAATYASKVDLNVKSPQFGAVGNGVADDTAAIQAAINAAAPGQAIVFPPTGSGAYYKITAGLTITTPNVRLIGQPRDGYAMSIRCATANTTILTVKASGVVLQDIAFMGDVQAVNGVGATVNGVELLGSTDADLDALIKGCTFQWMANPVRLRGRNATVENTLFSNTLNGVIVDGKDAVYHVGANAAENRGNLIRNNRFHNIGANANNSGIEITANTKVLHAVIEGNHFDSTGGGRHIKATGTAGNLHGGITFLNNKHTEAQADAYNLTYVQNSSITGAHISALTGTSLYGSGVVLANCDTIKISNLFGLQLGNSGVVATACYRVHVENTRFRSIGLNPGTVGHGLDFNSSNSQCRFDRITVETTDGYGFNGNPADSYMTAGEFRSCGLGTVNSTTLRTEETEYGSKYVAKKERARPFATTKTLANTGTHLGFPHAVIAADGNLVVGWRDGANHAPSKGVMKIARYDQYGNVLTSPATAYADATYDCRDAGLLLLADGRLAYTFFLYDQTAQTPLLDGVRVMFSSDNGVTWGAPVVIDSAFTTWAASAGAMIQLANGNLLMPTYGVSAGKTFQHAHVSRSTDGGATWAPLGVIADGDVDARHYQEPNIIVTDAGDILAVIRSDTALAHFTARSSDGGATWSATTNAFPGSGSPRLTKQGGYLQCLHRHESTGRVVKISSGDRGVTWGNQIVLPTSGAYVSSAYGVAVPYGKDSLRYIYSLQNSSDNTVATANIFQVDSIVAEDRGAPGPITCRLRMNSSVQVNSATWTTLIFALEDHNTDQMHSNTVNNSRLTINTAGYYVVKGTVYMAASATPGQVQARVIKNGVAGIPGLRDKKLPTANQDALVTVADIVYLNAGDYLQLQAYQDSGAALSARTEDTTFSAALVGTLI